MGRLAATFGQLHANAVCGQCPERVHQRVIPIRRHCHPQDAGKLPSHARHAAFQPITLEVGDALGDPLDLAGLVRGDHGKHKMFHGMFLEWGSGHTAPRCRHSIGKARQPAAGQSSL